MRTMQKSLMLLCLGPTLANAGERIEKIHVSGNVSVEFTNADRGDYEIISPGPDTPVESRLENGHLVVKHEGKTSQKNVILKISGEGVKKIRASGAGMINFNSNNIRNTDLSFQGYYTINNLDDHEAMNFNGSGNFVFCQVSFNPKKMKIAGKLSYAETDKCKKS